MMSGNKVWIGIDPDVKKSGVAKWEDGKLELYNFEFFELYDTLGEWSYSAYSRGKLVKVRLEAGFLNKKANWHSSKEKDWKTAQSEGLINSRIAGFTGANHQVAKLIEEMCKRLKLDYELVKPVNKKLKGEEFKKITRYAEKTNQETRDAGMLVYGF
jgi:hypothetical protein